MASSPYNLMIRPAIQLRYFAFVWTVDPFGHVTSGCVFLVGPPPGWVLLVLVRLAVAISSAATSSPKGSLPAAGSVAFCPQTFNSSQWRGH